MEEDKAHAYYMQQKQAGAGAATAKQGLGFEGGKGTPQGPPPASGPAQPPQQQAPPPAQQPPAAGPSPTGPPPAGPPSGPPPGFAPPGVPPPYMARGPPGMLPPGMPPYCMRPPFMPPGPPPPGWGFRPPPGMPPPGYMHRPGMPPPYGGPPGAPPLARPPPARPPQARPPPARPAGPAAAAAKREEEEKQRRAAEAWSAYKSDDGSVYYYNQVTGESSWERPAEFKGDVDKASSNPVPVSTEKIPGTDWQEVTCDDGKKYWYNPKSEETTWHVPPEVEAQAALKLDPVKAKMLERAKAMGAQVAPEYAAAVGGPGAAAAGAAVEDDFDVTFTEDDLGLGGEEAEPEPAADVEPEAEAAAGDEAEAAPGAAPAAAPAAAAPPAGMPPPHMPPPQHMPPPHVGPPQHIPPPPHMGAPHMPPPPMPPGQQHWAGQPPRPGMPPHPGMPHQGGMPQRLHMPPPPRPPQYRQPPPAHPPQPRPPAAQQQQQQAGGAGLPSYLPAPPEAPGKTGYGPSGYMPAAEAVGAFKALLAEKGVHAFSRYERELPKLQGDKRFKYIPSVTERKAVFEEYCKEAGTGKKGAASGKAGGAGGKFAGGGAASGSGGSKAGTAQFETLLDEIQAACSASEREEGVPAWGADATLAQLQARWGSDPRWGAATAAQRQAALDKRLAAWRKQAEADYRALLKEHRVSAGFRWSRTKDDLAEDPRYQALPRDDREDLFRDYVAELAKAEDRERQLEAKQREAERRAESERRAADQRRRTAARADALAHFKALLQELHLAPDARWRDYADRIARDAQGRGSNPALERGEAEALFREHVQELYEEALEAFLDLLDREIKPLIPSREDEYQFGLPKPLGRWRDAEPLLEEDTRCARMPPEFRERVWRRYVDDELWNRDHPHQRVRTQRKPPKEEEAEAEERGVGARRPRPPSMEDGGGLDKAYLREYLDPEAKRLRRE